MPPKRKAKAPATAAATTTSSSENPPAKRARRSKLAKEHGISAQEEDEMREAFSLFSEPMDGETDGVLPIDDLRSAMVALGIPPRDSAELKDFASVLDPDGEGFATFEPFVAVCALKLHDRDGDDDAHRQELDDAFRLFTHAGAGLSAPSQTQASSSSTAAAAAAANSSILSTGSASGGGGGTGVVGGSHITMAHLRRVAAVLNEDVSDEVLRDMILEANGGVGVARGVDKGGTRRCSCARRRARIGLWPCAPSGW
jgi:hydroxyacylglutathione hydrolase